jgi:hypothetical protein
MSVVKVWVRTRSARVAPAAASCLQVFAHLADLGAHVSLADDLARLVAGEEAGYENELAANDGNDRRIEHVPADHALRQRVRKQVLPFDHPITPS